MAFSDIEQAIGRGYSEAQGRSALIGELAAVFDVSI